jgi:hypothetical protein
VFHRVGYPNITLKDGSGRIEFGGKRSWYVVTFSGPKRINAWIMSLKEEERKR